MNKVRDDTETIKSTRSQATSSAPSISWDSSLTASDLDFDLNEAPETLPVYRRSLQQLVPSIGAPSSQADTNNGRSPFTDDGYSDTPRHTSSVTGPLFDTDPPRQGYLLLPTSPSAPVHIPHRRATSYQDPPRPGLENMPRSKSDSKTSKTLERSASELERISSLLRLNTSSRLNLASSSSKGSLKVRNDISVTPVKSRQKQNPPISIDLTGADAASIPQIVKAAQAGSQGEVARLIEYGIKIEERHKASGRNALLVAAHCGKDDVVELLIRHHARLDVTDGSGSTALHLAASHGHCGVISLLMENSNIAEVPNYRGRTALRIAVDRSQHEALKMLLMHRAKVNTRAENQMTALHTAAKLGDAEIVSILVSNGADIEAKDATMMSVLHYACQGGHVEVIAVLLAHKANIEAAGRDHKTPLICAAEAGRSQAVKFLLKSKQKASLNGMDDTGMTALHWAAYSGHEETVEILSQKKGSLDKINAMGRTALHLSVIQTKFAVVEPLLRKGADLNSQCAIGLNPLHYACMADSIGIATLLLLEGVDIEASEYQNQQRPLHIAAARSSIHFIDLLCEKGASLDARDSVGDRPLSVACRCGAQAVGLRISSLPEEPSYVTQAWRIGIQKGRGRLAAFHYAAYHGHLDVLQVLLARTSISDTDVSEIIRSDERTFNQALADSGMMPPSRTSSMLRNVNRGNYPGQYLQSPNSRERENFLPQELPATIEHGLPISRSTTPERGYRAEPPQSIDPLWHIRMRQGEQIPPPVNPQIASIRNGSRGVSPIPQLKQDPAGRILSRSPARGEPPVSATFIPRQIPVFTSQIPKRSSGKPPRCSRTGGSAAGTTPVQSDSHSQESRVPRTIPPRRESEFPIPRPEDPSERTQDTIGDPSDSDSDSISSVYTAPEEYMDADVA
ncbi:hypothetical protein N7463_010448 [Penicillium fimorum]|uniref:Ankyrin repeat protein n=1 Tax=Penicillium fimorum TaxID=1882269 RepID=A0A9W9XJZ0_9EURO|nr:hypothetical protein N7463_010448 [Penicillium fimorum]